MTAPYIVFEGIDGSGKTAVSKALMAAVKSHGGAVARLHQPGNVSRAGQLIHEVFSGRAPFTSKAMFWLFAAELADLEPRVEEMRNNGVTVISDRHTMFSAFVYQMPIHGRVVVEAALRAIKPALPTLTYLIDVPADIVIARQRVRPRNKLYEPADVKKLEELIVRYRNLPEWLEPPTFWPRNIKILDGTRPIQDNVRFVLDDLDLGGAA